AKPGFQVGTTLGLDISLAPLPLRIFILFPPTLYFILSHSRLFFSLIQTSHNPRGRNQRTASNHRSVREFLPLDSTSSPPSLFDGTTRLYISYTCPYAQRVWITMNCKGLQEKIQLIPIDLQNRPAWYKEKVYPANEVPSLEHNNEVRGESLDLIKYIDSHFGGHPLFTNVILRSVSETALDYIETAVSKYKDGPFFLGQLSLVDIAYAPFIERFQPFLLEVKKYDIAFGRPKLAMWIEAKIYSLS
ncbi:PREDICTED: glutathione S-transferase L1-like, partial [Nelumbo nucifera]|uniref:Glutathione S-transferase L1-like n=1 Tax=Nelumbo nucifera TaxID=4432 RepID=A0A1U8Q737_NELNU